MTKRKYSSIIDRESPEGYRGVTAYNREQIHQWLYDHSDDRGIIVYTQQQIAEMLEIGYQNLSTIFSDFVETGLLKKHGPRFFEVVYHPEELDWGEINKKQREVRKKHQFFHRQKGLKNG